ncbi:MAG: DUF3160 domain-containing protein [Candidatus Heimdallarchaeota archaeon]|nr:DUF3160 domain-containing protein [Candidatus Heimdallarchaeota archaeon]
MKILRNKKLMIISSSIIVVIIATNLAIFLPQLTGPNYNSDWDPDPLLEGTASTFDVKNTVSTSFGSYVPADLDYNPSIIPTEIAAGLSNVNLQGLQISSEIKEMLATYGFAMVDEGYEDIYDIYADLETPKFITTDLCLHAYHVLYDISLRVLEGERFFYDFETMLTTLRDAQISLNGTVSEPIVHDAINRNVAYLSVMLYLINETNTIPAAVESLTQAELDLINSTERAYSAIFGYEEDYTQYIVRGHYTRNEILANYFRAMMYAGRMGFLLQSPFGDPAMGIDHTRMAILMLSSFNTSISSDTVWDYWDRIYEPTVFYVGSADDLTPAEYYQIWQDLGGIEGDGLAAESYIEDFIEEAKTYRKPLINSMFVFETEDHENVTQGFRLMGQRFIPDSYVFQQLVHTKVGGRLMPTGLDVFSVFGSPRADYYMANENVSFPDYDDQIFKLREEFGNLTEYDWTQNLYWMWLYSLFPLLEPASLGFPGFMLSNAWSDKALMTASASWAELRHDTILYAKQSYTYETSMPEIMKGYVEPYPEVYARLASLVRLMESGLDERGLFFGSFSSKLVAIADIFDNLVELSIKELENIPFTLDEIYYINTVATLIEEAASFNDPDAEEWVSEADDRMAVIADVHTDPNTGNVLEVASGDPFVIYVVVQDEDGKLRLARGGTFSYYEFHHPMVDRLTDEGWQEMLDTNPPPLPEWMLSSLPLVNGSPSLIFFARKED